MCMTIVFSSSRPPSIQNEEEESILLLLLVLLLHLVTFVTLNVSDLSVNYLQFFLKSSSLRSTTRLLVKTIYNDTEIVYFSNIFKLLKNRGHFGGQSFDIGVLIIKLEK